MGKVTTLYKIGNLLINFWHWVMRRWRFGVWISLPLYIFEIFFIGELKTKFISHLSKIRWLCTIADYLSIGPKFIIDRLHILWGFCGFWRFGRLSFWFLNSQNDENLYLLYNIGEATNGHDSPMVKVELSPSCRWNTEALGSSLAGGPSAAGRGFWTQVECLRSTHILLLALRAPCLSKYSS